MLVSFALQLSVDCRGCNIALPVNGIVDELACYRCAHAHRLDAEYWHNKLREDDLVATIAKPGKVEEHDVLTSAGRYRLTYGYKAPACASCDAELGVDALAAAVEGGTFACAKCQHAARVRAADELVRAVDGRARFVVGETALDAAGAEVQRAKRPVLFACMGCGGALRVDGSSRSVTCDHCQQPNYLPDGLWQELSPIPKPRMFFLVCDYDAIAMRGLRWEEHSDRVAIAKRGDLTQKDFQRLLEEDDERIAVVLAGNASLSAEQVEQIAARTAMDEPKVLRVLAAHPALSHERLLAFAAEAPVDVVQRLPERTDLAADVVERCATHDSAAIRERIVKQSALSHETLRKLATDEDSKVKAAARARVDELRAQGVDIKPVGGLFSRLFGG